MAPEVEDENRLSDSGKRVSNAVSHFLDFYRIRVLIDTKTQHNISLQQSLKWQYKSVIENGKEITALFCQW